ncbi:GTPase Era [Rickettsiales bacterium]|nr:GTPase Era [Rickettsiales bacterium]
MTIADNSNSCIFVSICGAPNAGKSTLVNNMVGGKISIVSPKVQTTRVSVRGVCMQGSAQIVLVDTPGIFTPKRSLEKMIVEEAWKGVGETDVTALVIDARKGICDDTKNIIKSLKESNNKKVILVLNKIDKINRDRLLPLTKEINDYADFDRTFMISAIKGNGIDDLKKYLADIAPKGPWMFPEDEMSDAPLRFMAAEITREKLFLILQQELPYSIAVETEKWEDCKDGSIKINQVIYVEKSNQKSIVLGKGGKNIKIVGEKARNELGRILNTKIHLFLFVKIKENWTQRPQLYTGYNS